MLIGNIILALTKSVIKRTRTRQKSSLHVDAVAQVSNLLSQEKKQHKHHHNIVHKNKNPLPKWTEFFMATKMQEFLKASNNNKKEFSAKQENQKTMATLLERKNTENSDNPHNRAM